MFDWNNDGKVDWHDDALFHEVIDKEHESKNTVTPPRRSSTSSQSTSTASKWIINGICALCIYVVYQLYCGGVPINGFSALLCLGCAIRLVYSLFNSF